jgi:competence protein ComEC
MMSQAEHVFVRLMIPFAIGIVAFYNDPAQNTYIILSYSCLLCVCMLLLCNLGYARFSIYNYKPAVMMGVYLLTFLLAGMLTVAHRETLKDNYFTKIPADFLLVRVDDEPQLKTNIIRFKAFVIQGLSKDKQTLTSGHLLVSVKLDSLSNLSLSYGDELLIPCKFQDIKAAQNPFQFDVKSWLANQNIYQQSFLGADEVFKTASNTGNPVIAWALKLRKRQVDIYQQRMHNTEAFSVASTLLLGYRSDLSAETLMAYSKTGTIHALSASGMHVGLIYLVLNFILAFLERNKIGKLLKLILMIALIWFYALLTGLSPSVLRSVIMLSLYILAKTFRKNTNSYNIIAFSAFCILLYNPFLLYDVGFQLSYISVLGLVLLQPKVGSWFSFKYTFFNKLWSALALSLSAQIATFPFALYYFHQFPIYFLLSNLFITLPITLIMYLGLIILIGRLYFLVPVFSWLISFTNRGLQIIAGLPFSTVSGIWIDKLQLLLLVAGLALLIVTFSYYQKRLFLPALICLLSVISSCTYKKWIHYDQRKLIFFSLPKDYAIGFIQGDHATLLTNLTSGSPTYRFYVEPMLTQMQVVNTTFLKSHQDYRTKGLTIKDHQISFYDKSIFVADSCFNYKSLQTSANMDMLWITGNSKVKLYTLLQKLRPAMILIDGTNSNYSAEYSARQAKNFKIPSYNLKKLEAYLVNINK